VPTPPLTESEVKNAVQAVEARLSEGLTIHKAKEQAAKDLGLSVGAVNHRMRLASQHGIQVPSADPTAPLQNVGYDIAREDLTPEAAWEYQADVFERTISDRLDRNWREIKRPSGPGVIFHATDLHLDDNSCPTRLVEKDIEDSKALGALMCSGGDVLNNWPMAGRLAKQHAYQECTLPRSLLLLQHYIDIMQPDVWTNGNHEEMNPYLTELIEKQLPKKTLTDYWTVNFVLKPKKGRDIRCVMSHKFGKGSSWFHKTHGHIREMLEGEEADLYLDGHVHSEGIHEHSLPERNHSALLVASAGYKCTDHYARRISRGGDLKLRGRAHWIVYDPEAGSDESLCTAFKSARKAEAMLNGLQNLRAV